MVVNEGKQNCRFFFLLTWHNPKKNSPQNKTVQTVHNTQVNGWQLKLVLHQVYVNYKIYFDSIKRYVPIFKKAMCQFYNHHLVKWIFCHNLNVRSKQSCGTITWCVIRSFSMCDTDPAGRDENLMADEKCYLDLFQRTSKKVSPAMPTPAAANKAVFMDDSWLTSLAACENLQKPSCNGQNSWWNYSNHIMSVLPVNWTF